MNSTEFLSFNEGSLIRGGGGGRVPNVKKEVVEQWYDVISLFPSCQVERAPLFLSHENPGVLLLPPPLPFLLPSLESFSSSIPVKKGQSFPFPVSSTEKTPFVTEEEKKEQTKGGWESALCAERARTAEAAACETILTWLSKQLFPSIPLPSLREEARMETAEQRKEPPAPPRREEKVVEEDDANADDTGGSEIPEEIFSDAFLTVYLKNVKRAPLLPFPLLFYSTLPSPSAFSSSSSSVFSTLVALLMKSKVARSTAAATRNENETRVREDPPRESISADPQHEEGQGGDEEKKKMLIMEMIKKLRVERWCRGRCVIPTPDQHCEPSRSTSSCSSSPPSPPLTVAALIGFNYQVGFLLLYQRVYCDGCGFPLSSFPSRCFSFSCASQPPFRNKTRNAEVHHKEETKGHDDHDDGAGVCHCTAAPAPSAGSAHSVNSTRTTSSSFSSSLPSGKEKEQQNTDEEENEATAGKIDFDWLGQLMLDAAYRRCFQLHANGYSDNGEGSNRSIRNGSCSSGGTTLKNNKDKENEQKGREEEAGQDQKRFATAEENREGKQGENRMKKGEEEWKEDAKGLFYSKFTHSKAYESLVALIMDLYEFV